LPDAVHMTTIYAMIIITTVVLVCVQIPAYVAFGVTLVLGFIFLQWYTSPGVQKMKALVSKTNAPIFSLVRI